MHGSRLRPCPWTCGTLFPPGRCAPYVLHVQSTAKTNMYIHIYIYMRTQINEKTEREIDRYECMYLYAGVCIVYVYPGVFICIYLYILCIYTHVCVYMYAYTYMYMSTHICIHTCKCSNKQQIKTKA